jgi:hypothetical protein
MVPCHSTDCALCCQLDGVGLAVPAGRGSSFSVFVWQQLLALHGAVCAASRVSRTCGGVRVTAARHACFSCHGLCCWFCVTGWVSHSRAAACPPLAWSVRLVVIEGSGVVADCVTLCVEPCTAHHARVCGSREGRAWVAVTIDCVVQLLVHCHDTFCTDSVACRS